MTTEEFNRLCAEQADNNRAFNKELIKQSENYYAKHGGYKPGDTPNAGGIRTESPWKNQVPVTPTYPSKSLPSRTSKQHRDWYNERFGK